MIITSRLGECRKCAEWRTSHELLEERCAESEKRLALMEDKVGRLYADLTKSNARVQQLQELLAGRSKDSTNSSKPPSSDIVKPPPQKPAGSPRERKRGGQVGHAPQQRAAFEPGEIDAVQQHRHESCPQCGGPVEQLPMPAEVVQQVELVQKPTIVTEHQSCTCRCGKC